MMAEKLAQPAQPISPENGSEEAALLLEDGFEILCEDGRPIHLEPCEGSRR